MSPRKQREKRHIGRPSIFEEGLSEKDILKVYEKGLSCRKGAAELGIDPKTYRKYLAKLGMSSAGYKRPSPGPTIEFANGYRVPKLLLWCREHPHRKLPRSLKRIAQITEIPFETVRSYLVKRKHRMLLWAKSLGDLRALKGTIIIDDTGRHIPVEMISSYEMRIDIYDLKVKLTIVLRGGVYLKASLAWADYAALFGLGPKDAPWVPKKRVPKASVEEVSSPS